ncbi:hypothetical protein DSO57_1033678 [Entomophthora muscae]|uniref:Uncharacterized protein n=1 Tax=Entomophthora muscae TaxID=34485 RepID=A0ACC2SPT7_9FUNG|nr:hypothetical protein DSO57_1033678 [Entomophthora muscae]
MLGFILLVLPFSVVQATSAEDLADSYNHYSDMYPNHACASFKKKPFYGLGATTSEHPSSWKVMPDCNFFYCNLWTICIEQSAQGEYMIRNGDGGYDNWIFNPIYFRNENGKIIIK